MPEPLALNYPYTFPPVHRLPLWLRVSDFRLDDLLPPKDVVYELRESKGIKRVLGLGHACVAGKLGSRCAAGKPEHGIPPPVGEHFTIHLPVAVMVRLHGDWWS